MKHAAFPLWPVSASSQAVEIDHMIIAFTVLLVVLAAPVFLLSTYWIWKYREGQEIDRSNRRDRNVGLELSWMLIPFFLTLIFFFWSAIVYDRELHPPPNAMIIHAVGRQWMWKFQQPTGQWEINDLHVPIGTNIRIDVNSQDVIHELYIPALRIEAYAIPGRTMSLWFNADRAGRYRLYCAEYCGVDHSLMRGALVVMSKPDYANWLKMEKSR